LIIVEEDNNPPLDRWAIPVVSPGIVIIPVGSMVTRATPFVIKSSVFAIGVANPVVGLPVKLRVGLALVPAGSCKAPVIVSPVFCTKLAGFMLLSNALSAADMNPATVGVASACNEPPG